MITTFSRVVKRGWEAGCMVQLVECLPSMQKPWVQSPVQHRQSVLAHVWLPTLGVKERKDQ